MPNSWDNDTLIHLDIQADNKPEIIQCVCDSIQYMDGWDVGTNVKMASNGSRFYTFNLSTKRFVWWRGNNSLSDTMDEDEVPIRDLADISHLLEYVYVNADTLRKKCIVPGVNATIFDSVTGLSGWESIHQSQKKKRKRIRILVD